MQSTFIKLESPTQANKARRYLGSIDIKSSVEKISGSGGCSYGIRVYGDAEKICRLLSNVNIVCLRLIRGD